jgi:hypothetical protein
MLHHNLRTSRQQKRKRAKLPSCTTASFSFPEARGLRRCEIWHYDGDEGTSVVPIDFVEYAIEGFAGEEIIFDGPFAGADKGGFCSVEGCLCDLDAAHYIAADNVAEFSGIVG